MDQSNTQKDVAGGQRMSLEESHSRLTCEARKRQGGFALLQFLLTMLFGLLVMAGVGYMYSRIQSSANMTKAQEQIHTIRVSVQSIFTGQPGGYQGLSNDVAKNAGIIPRDMIKGSSVTNSWNGAVTLAPSTPITTFTLTYEDVPQDACVSLATVGEWVSVTVNSTTIPSGAGSVVAASSACQSGGNRIVFQSY